MKSVVAIQHVDREGPGRIADVFAERGIPVKCVDVFAGAPVPTALAPEEILVVMGGGMGVGDRDDPALPFLNAEIALLKTALRDGNPILGICLGAQLLAHAAGGAVFPNRVRDTKGNWIAAREVGWAPIQLDAADDAALAGLGSNLTVLHWHGDTFDLPPGAVHLASTPLCRNQAYRLGNRVFGLQFHIEVDAETADRWAIEDADFVRSARGAQGVEDVIAETKRMAESARAGTERMIRNIVGCMLT